MKIRTFITAHIWPSIGGVIVVSMLSYWGIASLFGDTAETRYVLGRVEKGTITVSISGSGQVAAEDKVDVKAKISGDIVWIGAAAGEMVYAGQTIAYLDATDAKQAIADAEQSLTQAKLQFQKDVAQAPIDYQKAIDALKDAQNNLKTAYNETFNAISNTFIDLPSTVTGMQNILYGYDLSPNKSQFNVDLLRNSSSNAIAVQKFADNAEADYKIARATYDRAITDYQTLTRYAKNEALEIMITSSVNTTTAIAQGLQSELNFLDGAIDDATTNNRTVSAIITTMRTNTRGYLSAANSSLNALLNQQKSLDANKKSTRDNQHAIDILKIGNANGDNPISLQSARYSIADQERKLRAQKDDLYKFAITAPFSGVITAINAKRGDTVSNGSIAATIITNQKIAEVSLNEIDVAHVKIGQKVTTTFDAIEGLTMTGKVASLDTVGTVSQGVVTYNVKISFDGNDERIKSGMSITTTIITDAKNDTLFVASSAVKDRGMGRYVERFANTISGKATGGNTGITSKELPIQQLVETGLSNDTQIEIINGLKEGDQIIMRTIVAQPLAATPNAPSIFGGVGGNRVNQGGGGARLR